MAMRTREGAQFFADFSGTEKAIGAVWGVLDATDNQEYRNDLIQTAYHSANEEFNLEAAAFAAAGGNIKHMFEWGTVGINRHRTNMRPNPMSENARLWKPLLMGHGPSYHLDFSFKPSVAFVPKPTSGETGMDPAIIAEMRDHVFYNKAMVMETGMEVTIKLKEAEFLLFPFYKGHVPDGARSNDIARGYTLNRGPVSLRPGAQTAGNFNAYWTQFWNDRGNDFMNASVQTQLDEDFDKSVMTPRTSQALKRVVPGQVTAAINAERKRVHRNALARARYRRKKEEARRG